VMFVSAQAVRMFFAQRPMQAGPRFWATGPGTRLALIEAGVATHDIDAPNADSVQFDSEALWQVVSPSLKKQVPVLIVRGNEDALISDPPLNANVNPNLNTSPNSNSSSSSSNKQPVNPQGVGRDWLAQQIIQAGASVEFVVAYSRRPPQWSAPQLEIAKQAAFDGSVWCLSSSQAVLHLQAQLPNVQWNKACCVVTHARIAQTARDVGFVHVVQTRPVLSDVLASLESFA